MRHKLSFGGGILYFTADREKNLYGVVASEDYPMAQVFDFLDEMLEAFRLEISQSLKAAFQRRSTRALTCLAPSTRPS